MITDKERDGLIADLRNQTEMGRLNEDVIRSIFDKIGELGFELAAIKAVEEAPEVVEAPAPETPKPTRRKATVKSPAKRRK